MKLAVVGGGSTYTPELIEGIARRSDRFTVDELVLLDIDHERLEIVGGLAGRMLQRLGWPGSLVLTSDTDQALDGADFVLIQLRVGGQAARLVDETLPPRFGTIGQETTGAGGFAKALRTVPVVLDLAERVARRAAPGAWIVDFTNPVGIVSQALLDEGHRAIGLCNVAIGFQRRFAAQFGVEPERVELDHVGLNHLSWARAVKVDGVDRLPGLIETEAERIAKDCGSPVEIVRLTRSIPSYYLKYYYSTDVVLDDQLEAASESRAQQVMDIEGELLDMYRNPSLDVKPKLLERRGGAFYSEAAAQLIASLHDGRGDVQVVDIRNGYAGPAARSGADGGGWGDSPIAIRALPDLPDSAVVEVPARITREGAIPIEQAALAPEMRGLVQAMKAYEELAVAAAISGDRGIALKALLANPLVARWSIAAPLLDALLDANRAHLPRFFPA
ncbi:MAG TPA: 6-phospho-beta-glucosidase [Candidatus Dormibacteraeota bacterium]|nr:6-phospho-beta-glucosidase [Candidatus Dormibacteraeota bacterium]